MKKVIAFRPENLGWLDYKLNSQEMDYVWRCISNKKNRVNSTLAGHISGSYILEDKSSWFYLNTLLHLIKLYDSEFPSNRNARIPTNQFHPYTLHRWWVNYQKKHEYNPFHNHTGVFSFVIWMKIPYKSKDQLNIPIARDSNYASNGSFALHFIDILGQQRSHHYHLNPEDEGRMLFFPSQLHHCVYPFFECDEDRITVSGNILLNTAKSL